MTHYGIADYLTLDQRRAIVRARYTNVGRTYKQRITGEGCCPMGVLGLDYDACTSAPDGGSVALALYRNADLDFEHDDPEEWIDRVTTLAQEFIDAWDSGQITPADLPRVLGVQP